MNQDRIDALSEARSSRIVALEAGRGVAAFIVLFHHFLLAFAPGVKMALADTPIGWLQNGTGAVMFFFALSGFVLTFRTFSGAGVASLGIDAAKRWPRLWLAPAISVLLGAIVLLFGWNANEAAAALSGSEWLRDFGNARLPAGFQPGLLDALGQTVSLWVGAKAGYNSSLWTMQWELLGSFIVFGLAGVLWSARPAAVAIVVAVLLASLSATLPYAVPFVLGCVLAYALARQPRASRREGVLALLVGLLLLSCEQPERMFLVIALVPDQGRQLAEIYIQSIGALAVILALRSGLESLIAGRFARWLGQLSFPVYLTQVAAICTLSSVAFVGTAAYGSFLQCSATLLVTLIWTILLALPLVALDRWWRAVVNQAAAQA